MRHLNLFAGIGGASLAAEMVWDDVEHIFVENDPFCQAILRKHWPDAKIYGDIKEFDGREVGKVDFVTGGFPCQPFSAAGRRRGTEDDRHLWPEMLRVIRETNPRWVLGENVGGFLTWDGGLVFEQVCTDLEAEGYEVCPFVIPACAVNAPHRRDRVWIAAHRNCDREREHPGELREAERRQNDEVFSEPHRTNTTFSPGDPEHTRQHGSEDRESGIEGGDSNKARSDKDVEPPRPALSRDDAEDTQYKSTGHTERGRDEERTSIRTPRPNPQWREDWPTVAARLCTVDDGLPDGLARPRGWRNAALKGAGNAIVPQVAAEILKAMKLCSEQR